MSSERFKGIWHACMHACAHGRAVIIWNNKLIERLKKDERYTSCFIPTPSETPSESSEPSVEERKDAIMNQ